MDRPPAPVVVAPDRAGARGEAVRSGDIERPLARLAEAYGVALRYYDQAGALRLIDRRTVVAVLGSLGVEADSPESVARALSERGLRDWRRALPTVLVCREDRVARVPVHVARGGTVEVAVAFEDGRPNASLKRASRKPRGRVVDGSSIERVWFELPRGLPIGWHELRITAGSGSSTDQPPTCQLIVTPGRLETASRIGGRAWGLMAQIYSLRSSRSWGIGDLGDLRELAAWAGGSLGAGFCLVNPMHADAVVPPLEDSPYLPSSRRFANPLYLRIEDITEFAHLSQSDQASLKAEAAAWTPVNRSPNLLDRTAVWKAKRRALELLYLVPMGPGRRAQFDAYVAGQGQGLRLFATWCALTEEYGPRWRQWPQELRDPDSRAVALSATRLSDRVRYHCWLQWQLDQQLALAQRAALDVGMSIGVIQDLPVGVNVDSADTWALRGLFADAVHVGAPPDLYNQLGQDWTQPPWRPEELAERAYIPYRDMLRTVLRNAGGLRVDHVLGLFRQWWIPEGMTADKGTYVSMDHEALVGILVLEAERAGAVVIGEDLGTVEAWIRDYLSTRGVLGTGVLWFERSSTGAVMPPESWAADTLTSVTVHDLPPTAGYIRGDHVRLRNRLGLLTKSVLEEHTAHEQEIELWRRTLQQLGLLDVGAQAGTSDMVVALHKLVAASPALLIGVSLPDLTADRRSQNQPGTHREYPNWCVPLCDENGEAVLLEDLGTAPMLAQIVSAVRGY